MGKLINPIGQKFGRLIVREQAGRDKWGNSKWLCECECGNKIIVRGSNLKNGNTKSCGCLAKNNALKHGYSGKDNRTYESWHHMKERFIKIMVVEALRFAKDG